MGKRQHTQDKLYVTKTEWSTLYGGKNAGKQKTFKRLPWNSCCLSFQPVQNPVIDAKGNMFDLMYIVPYLKRYGTSPITGEPLKLKDLKKITIHKNTQGKPHDPVTLKELIDSQKIVVCLPAGNVYLYNTVETLNIKAKNWHDLLTDEPFKRSDIITVLDPQNPEKQNYSEFHHVVNKLKVLSAEDKEMLSNPSYNIKTNTAEIRSTLSDYYKDKTKREQETLAKAQEAGAKDPLATDRVSTFISDNQMAGSFTSTSAVRVGTAAGAVYDEDYVRYGKIKKSAYVRIKTNKGDMNIELYCALVPKTCENFLLLAQKGHYNGTAFHRSIKNFMIQGGDPTGTGSGGESAWGGRFADEFHAKLSHEGRGMLSMANNGEDSNGSQFFITYRSCKHLDNKHSVFGKVVGGIDTLSALEKVPVNEKTHKPKEALTIQEITIFVNPFKDVKDEEVQQAADKAKAAAAEEDRRAKEIAANQNRAHRNATNATGKGGVGKYMTHTPATALADDTADDQAPKKKKVKTTQAFGDSFSKW